MMRRIVALLLVAMAGLSAAARANAAYVFQPKDADLSDLPHDKYFTWGINFTLPANETITGATLEFANIWDWTTEKNDHLFIHLLDNPKSGVKSFIDNERGGDNFAGKGVLVGNWSDPIGGHPRNFNLIYDFGSGGLLDELKAYAATTPGKNRDNFGFGIDPDCHYYNCGITFTITTECGTVPGPVPEPTTVVMLTLGGLLLRRRTA